MTDMRSRALWTRVQTMRTSTMVAVGILVVLMALFYIKDSNYRERVSQETHGRIRKLEADSLVSQKGAKSLDKKTKVKVAQSNDVDGDQDTFSDKAVTSTTTQNPGSYTTLDYDSDDGKREELDILKYKKLTKDKKIAQVIFNEDENVDGDDDDDATTTSATPTTTQVATTTEKTIDDDDGADDADDDDGDVNANPKKEDEISIKKIDNSKIGKENFEGKHESNNVPDKNTESIKPKEDVQNKKVLIDILGAETKRMKEKNEPVIKQLPVDSKTDKPENPSKSLPLLKIELPEKSVMLPDDRTDKNGDSGSQTEQQSSNENQESEGQKEVRDLHQAKIESPLPNPGQVIKKKTENEMHEPVTPKDDNVDNNDMAAQIKMLALKYSITLNETDLPRQSESYTKRLRNKLIQTGRFDLLESKNCKKRLPKCIIIGVMKAGTEAFSTFLGVHPQVAMQFGYAAMVFFSSSQYDNGLEWYRERMMCSTKDQITMEKSPQYFSSQLAPKRIHSMDPNMKLILLVRDPISRALSHFLQQKSANPDRLKAQTFEDCVYDKKTKSVISSSPYIQQSTYSVILKRWLHYFSFKQILIVDGDTFKKNPIRSLHKAETFLDIDHSISKDRLYFNKEKGFYCLKINSSAKEDLEMSCFGSEKGRIHPSINPEVEKALQKYFRPYNEEFMKMTSMKMKWK